MVGVDDFPLRRRHRYATIVIDAETGKRVDALPDREVATLTVSCGSIRAARSGHGLVLLLVFAPGTPGSTFGPVSARCVPSIRGQ
ncbi:hypothetical protein [Streptomyces finlayi]|uniref:hypothetical protein n=1 Tax=Streptomyces finlayi TaxID=67296 RepID=UPI00162651A1|nr:hypothetical protein [Streptomyces finlayi]